MNKTNIKLAGLTLATDTPTRLTREELDKWVIWQFPHPHADGFRGAVHPPVAGHGWYPALIRPKAKDIQLFGNIPNPFSSPEEAISFFN